MANVPLKTIIDRLAKRIDFVLNHPPRTSLVGGDNITTFDGKVYKNLSCREVEDLRSGAYWAAYRAWEEARRYDNYLGHHFTPCADYYLREMRNQINK